MLPTFKMHLFFLIGLIVMQVQCEPGAFYYREPTKLVFYKKHHQPVFTYPSPKKAAFTALPDSQHVKYGKYFLLNPNFVEHLLDYDIAPKKTRPPKRWPVSWMIHDEGHKLQHSSTSYNQYDDGHNEPVFSYYPRKYLKGSSHAPAAPDDIKPVVEHIEDDLKYDFRTKTHSYDR